MERFSLTFRDHVNRS